MKRLPETLRVYKVEGELVRKIVGKRLVYIAARGNEEAFKGLFSANPIQPDNRCGDVRITQVSLDNVPPSRDYAMYSKP